MRSWKIAIKPYRKLLLLGVMLVVVVLINTPGQVAHAASLQTNTDECSGSDLGGLIESDPLWGPANNPVPSWGTLNIYYNNVSGCNFAMVVSSDSTWGQPKHMHVNIEECAETGPTANTCEPINTQSDAGLYKIYAGPVGVPGRGHCIGAYGWIEFGDETPDNLNFQLAFMKARNLAGAPGHCA